MGKLVAFERRPKPAKAGMTIPGDAQILMFTGVRYERGTPTKTVDPSRPKRKRG